MAEKCPRCFMVFPTTEKLDEHHRWEHEVHLAGDYDRNPRLAGAYGRCWRCGASLFAQMGGGLGALPNCLVCGFPTPPPR